MKTVQIFTYDRLAAEQNENLGLHEADDYELTDLYFSETSLDCYFISKDSESDDDVIVFYIRGNCFSTPFSAKVLEMLNSCMI